MVLIVPKETTKPPEMNYHHNNSQRSLTEKGITVTMLDDVNTKAKETRPNVYISPRDKSETSLVEGFHLPNRFRFDGLGVVVEMTVDAITRDGVPSFACSSLTVLPLGGSQSIETVERIKVATMLRMAVKCSRTLCRYYPANYGGAKLDHIGRPITHLGESSGKRITEFFGTAEEPTVLPLINQRSRGYQWSDDAIKKVLGQQPRRQKSSWTDEFLQEVADVYNNTLTYKRDAVIKKWDCKSPRTADNWISKCKELGYITPNKKRATK